VERCWVGRFDTLAMETFYKKDKGGWLGPTSSAQATAKVLDRSGYLPSRLCCRGIYLTEERNR